MECFIYLVLVLIWNVIITTPVMSACPGLPDVPHATSNTSSTGPFDDGTALKFTCNNGYRESGTNPTYTCSGSSWTGGNYKCNLIHCSRIDPPENGRITNSPDFAAGSSVTFSCDTGYDMNGASTLTCRTDGQWRPSSPPTCSVKMCPDFGSIANANTFQEASDGVKNDYGSVVRVTCNRNYILVGKNLVKCLANGQWEDKPTCEPVTCPPLAGASSSCIDTAVFYEPNMYILLCKDDSDTVSVTKLGKENGDTICKNNQWGQPEPACYCDCLMNTSASYISMSNLVKSKFLKHGETLSWSCSGAATKATDKAVTCMDGRLSTEPVCTPPPVTTTTRGIPVTTNGNEVTSLMSTTQEITTGNEDLVSNRTTTSPGTTTTSRPPGINVPKVIGIVAGIVGAIVVVWLLVCWRCPERLSFCPNILGGCLKGSCCHNDSSKPDNLAVIVPEFKTPLRKCHAAEGKTARFECEVTGTPKPEVLWYKGSRELVDNNKYEISIDGDTYTLTIRDVFGEDQGEYVVRASNKGGIKTSRADLEIGSPPKINVPPRFREVSTFEKGEDVILKIPFTGNPQPTVKWIRDGQDVAGHRFHIEVMERHALLNIKGATKEDDGPWRIQLDNNLGTDSAVINIQINEDSKKEKTHVTVEDEIELQDTISTTSDKAKEEQDPLVKKEDSKKEEPHVTMEDETQQQHTRSTKSDKAKGEDEPLLGKND